MTIHHGIIGTFPSNAEANSAVLELQKIGFEMQQFSLAKTVCPTNTGFLPGPMPSPAIGLSLVGAEEVGVLVTPDAGSILIAGYITGKLVNWVEETIADGSDPATIPVLGGLSAGLGIPPEKAVRCEAEIKAGNFVLLISGSHEEINRSRQILHDAGYQAYRERGADGANGIEGRPPHPVDARPPHPAGGHPPHLAGAHPPHPAGTRPSRP